MIQLSYWAYTHKLQSRVIIIILYVFLNVLGIFSGKLLSELNIIIPLVYISLVVIFSIIIWIAYPSGKNSKTFFATYRCRKILEFSIGLIGFFMVVYTGNHWKFLSVNAYPVQAAKITSIPKDSTLHKNTLIKNFIAEIKNRDIAKLSKNEKLKIVKQQIKNIKEEKGLSKSEKILLIILSSIIGFVLIGGIAILSCYLYCSGYEALAAIVALVGIPAGIFLLVFVIKKIVKSPTRKQKNKK